METIAKVIYWARTENDTRFTASTTGAIKLPQKYALKVAREINDYGESAVLEAIEMFGAVRVQGDGTDKAASSHGVIIVYTSDRQRHVYVD